MRYQHCMKKTKPCTYLRKIMVERVEGYIGVESYRFSDVDDVECLLFSG
jgi:hypothetical protein